MKKPVKLNKEIVDLLMPRISDEYQANRFYAEAANWCQDKGYFVAAKFFNEESADELVHAKGIVDFIIGWNVVPTLPDVEEQNNGFDSLLDIIEKAYAIEYALYEAYEDTSMKVFNKGDLCVFDLLQKYRTIQTESVAAFSDMMNVCSGVDDESKFEMLMLEETLFGE